MLDSSKAMKVVELPVLGDNGRTGSSVSSSGTGSPIELSGTRYGQECY